MEPTPNSTSPSPEAAFVGIDPDDTETTSFGGATFTARVLPAGLWDVLTAGDTRTFQEAQRKAIARLTAAGRDPTELAFPEGTSGVTILDIETTDDPEFMLSRTKAHLEAIKFGLLSHSGVSTKKGPVPFETEEVKVSGITFTALKKSTLRFYEVNRAVRETVYMLILKLNSLGALAKKA